MDGQRHRGRSLGGATLTVVTLSRKVTVSHGLVDLGRGEEGKLAEVVAVDRLWF